MTKATHSSGSERLAEVVERLGWADECILVNLQGDEPAMPAVLIDQVAADMAAFPDAVMATLGSPIESPDELFNPHVVKLVTDARGYAAYFSRAPIPWLRDGFAQGRPEQLPTTTPFLRHIGLYAYRAGFLRRYLAWPPSPLEEAESLEQLRVLWHGERIHVSQCRVRPGPGVDTQADLDAASLALQQRSGS
jgi:3-deoxy-manno-octulosonate cytidylyltransferase (CMP-KDO synthetase)